MSDSLRFVPFLAHLKREIKRFQRILFQSIASPLISSALYLTIFGVSLGREVMPTGHCSYLSFLIPGIIMMNVLRNAFENSSGGIVGGKYLGELEDLKVVPVTPVQIAWASATGGLIRGTLIGFFTLLLSYVFLLTCQSETFLFTNPPLAILFVILAGFAFGFLGLTVGMVSRSFDHLTAINSFILLPLIYLGGVFFSLDQLSPTWQVVARFNPLLYFVNGLRYSMIGVSDLSVTKCLIVSASSVALLYTAAIWSLRKGSYHRW